MKLFSTSFFKTWIFIASLGSGYLSVAQEICNNGIDDDGDGLVDCYDVGDCTGNAACANFYYGQPVPSCDATFLPPTRGYQLIEKYRTDKISFPIDQRASMYVMDMNSDGVPDLVSHAPAHADFNNVPPIVGDRRSQLYIFGGLDGVVIAAFTVPHGGGHHFSQVALGDVDADGNGDVFMVTNARRLVRFEYGTAAPIWVSNVGTGEVLNVQQSPQLADFDADGVPEVYSGNAIFNALDGTTLVQANASLNSGSYPGGGETWSLAFDVDGDGDLELITGNRVYDVDLVGGTLTERSFVSPADFIIGGNPATATEIGDGFTSIADLDGNGLVDIVVSRGHYLYAWEPSSAAMGNARGRVIFNPVAIGSGNRSGRACIGDFTGDQTREIAVVGQNVFCLYDYNSNTNSVAPLFTKVVDDGSGRTGCTLFDFEGDGKGEIVYSDEENLFIWNAAGDTLGMIQSQSGTRTDYPLVADIDADGQAEIIITAQDFNGPRNGEPGYIVVYESAKEPWVGARQNWNQSSFFNTNINTDGTIPQQQQSHIALPNANSVLNSFLSQMSQLSIDGDVIEPAPDLSITITDVMTDVDVTSCPEDIQVTLEACNNGVRDVNLSFPVSVYHEDPRSLTNNPRFLKAQLIDGITLAAGACLTLPIVDFSIAELGALHSINNVLLYFVINDSARGYNPADLLTEAVSLPNYPLIECDYSNNYHGPVSINNCRIGSLPIELGAFWSTLEGRRVRLNWMTETETNNSHFILQRSKDGLSYKNLELIAGHGTTTQAHYYEYIDEQPFTGVNYYRLKQVDFDGSFSYSNVLTEDLPSFGNSIYVYPNPANVAVTIDLTELDTRDVKIQLINPLGQVVHAKALTQAINQWEISTTDFPRGIYQLLLETKDGRSYNRSVVLR